MNVLIFGCGYLGSSVAQRWLAQGARVHVVTRSTERAAEFARLGLLPIVADITQPVSLNAATFPAELDAVLFAVGFDRAAGLPIETVYVEGLKNVLAALAGSLGSNKTPRFIYISSTGVYGPAGGEWIDESSPCQPTRPGGRACLAAEELLAAHPIFSPRRIVLRLAGIYGPGRIPRRADLLAGKPLDATPNGYLNLIHVEDAARIVLAVADPAQLSEPLAGKQLFVVSDGQPVIRGDYYRELAQLVGAPEPTFTPQTDSPGVRRAAEDKRVSPALLQKHLPVKLEYPNYRAGLAAIVAGKKSDNPETDATNANVKLGEIA